MKHILLFTGHMIDAPDRATPRFPASEEESVRAAIMAHIRKEQAGKKSLTGLAGGACGGDILFHECCAALGVPSEMYLAMPAEAFEEASVSFAGEGWTERYRRLLQALPVQVLPAANAGEERNVFERANLWMLDEALKNGGEQMTLLALWNGGGGDGKGGTEDMIKTAKRQDADAVVIPL